MSADPEGRAWDWLEDADDVVVKAQPAVAVYPGPAGVVIRLQGDWCDDADGVVWFGVDQARAVATAILEAAGLDATALTPELAQVAKPRDATGAERQRRRRARQKEPMLDIDRDQDRDTDRDTMTSRDGAEA